MAEPIFSTATEDLWASLPQIHRTQDGLQPVPAGGFPMKRWLSGLGDQLGDVVDLIARLDYAPPDDRDDPSQVSSDLADPTAADTDWLPWLAQLLGLGDIRGLTEAARRAALAGAVSGFRGGTKGAIASAVQPVLTGTQSIAVYDHSIAHPADGGGEWDVLVVTRGSETPGGSASVIKAVTDAKAKPAGVNLHHATTEVTWAVLIANRPTWAAWSNKTWTQIEETGL